MEEAREINIAVLIPKVGSGRYLQIKIKNKRGI
jgi:hypothetical protein